MCYYHILSHTFINNYSDTLQIVQLPADKGQQKHMLVHFN